MNTEHWDDSSESAGSAIPDIDCTIPESLETATFSLGCFWGPDAQFGCTRGVYRTRVGYTGGDTDFPTYDNLGTHSEAIQVEFDPDVLSLEHLAQLFWAKVRPQRAPRKRQYMHACWYHNERQKDVVLTRRKHLESTLGSEVQTPILPLTKFYPAEDRHQKYRLQHSQLMSRFRQIYPCFEEFNNSTAAARLNGFVGGRGERSLFKDEAHGYGIPPHVMLQHIQFPDTTSATSINDGEFCSVT